MFILLTLCSTLVIAPPVPRNVKGYILYSGGGQVPSSSVVKINNLNTSTIFTTYTSGPAPNTGYYSTTITASKGDIIEVYSWNTTAWGISNDTISKGTTWVNATLNLTRPGELNVSNPDPSNHSTVELDKTFNFTVNLTAIGGQDSTSCYATLTIQNSTVYYLTNNDPHQNVGDITLSNSKLAIWNITANNTGSSNFTINTSCSSDGRNFGGVENETVTNITSEDTVAPVISLESPDDDDSFYNAQITFYYNVSDPSGIFNCTLIIDGSVNKSNTTVTTGTSQNFTATLAVGDHNWSINCTDDSTNQNVNQSDIYNISIKAYQTPQILSMSITNPIDLLSGSTKTITCNASIYDADNATDIEIVNATLFASGYQSRTADDNNYHYTNATCNFTASSQYQRNYSCAFDLQYYANPGTWTCNITAEDSRNNVTSNTTNTTINNLISIDVSSSVIDFGQLAPSSYSTEDVNLTLYNMGNIDINITLKGFGVSDSDDLAMNCTRGTIPVWFERYSTTPGVNHSDMTNLTSNSQLIINYTLPQRINDTAYGQDANNTYWRLQTPSSIGTHCNGSVILNAILS